MSRNVVMVLASFLLVFLAGPSIAGETEEKSLWEVRIGGGVVYWPHYIGSNQHNTLPMVLPYVLYRGDFLRADREGLRGIFFSSKRFALDLSISMSSPVKSKNNDIRQNMPDIPFTAEIGPRIVFQIYGGEDGPDVLGRVPWRRVWDIHGNPAGWTVEPEILIRKYNMPPWDISLIVTASLLYGSTDYHDMFYSVDEQYSETWRPAYRAREGLNSYLLSVVLGHTFSDKFSTWFFVRWRNLSDSVVAESPLVKSRDNISAGLWFSWSYWESETKAKKKPRLIEPDDDIGS
ncbi:MAG: MipA/OmpV family protein [Nitrospinota bacterium]